jgi:hypothetical protein
MEGVRGGVQVQTEAEMQAKSETEVKKNADVQTETEKTGLRVDKKGLGFLRSPLVPFAGEKGWKCGEKSLRGFGPRPRRRH